MKNLLAKLKENKLSLFKQIGRRLREDEVTEVIAYILSSVQDYVYVAK